MAAKNQGRSIGDKDDEPVLSLTGRTGIQNASYMAIDGASGDAAVPQLPQVHHQGGSSTGWRGLTDRIGKKFFPLGYWKEFREIAKLHLPAFFTCFFQFFLQTISVIMCGHMSKEQLDAVALACTLINVAALTVGLGLSTGCDTYFAQTYGSQYKKRVGLYLQRSLFVMYMFMIPVYCLNINIKPILILLGQDPLISDMTARYILIFLPGIFFDYTFLVLARYLQTQNRVNPPLVCAVIGNVFNAVTQYIAIYVMGFEYEASAACQAASLFVMCVCILVYIRVSGVYEDTWDGWTIEALYDIGGFVKLAVPGLLLVALENVSFEIGTLVAGNISLLQLGAQAILHQTAVLLYMVSLGMSIAVNIRVGQHLGAGNIEGAKHSFKVAATIILCTSTIICVAVLLFKESIASIFTSDPEVKAAAVELFEVYTPFPYVDGLSATSSGVLKGSGRQLIGAIVNILAYYAIAIPIGLPLSLLTWLQMRGFWIGLLIGLSLETLVFLVIILRTDWHKEASSANGRAKGNGSSARGSTGRHHPDDAKRPLLADQQPSGTGGHVRSMSRVHSAPYESEAEVDVSEPMSLPPLAPVLRKRLLTCLCLLVCLVAAIVLRSFQDVYMTPFCPPISGNGTSGVGWNSTDCRVP